MVFLTFEIELPRSSPDSWRSTRTITWLTIRRSFSTITHIHKEDVQKDMSIITIVMWLSVALSIKYRRYRGIVTWTLIWTPGCGIIHFTTFLYTWILTFPQNPHIKCTHQKRQPQLTNLEHLYCVHFINSDSGTDFFELNKNLLGSYRYHFYGTYVVLVQYNIQCNLQRNLGYNNIVW